MLLALLLGGALALTCTSDSPYLVEDGASQSCVTAEACRDQGREPRESGFCREAVTVSSEAELLALGSSPYAVAKLAQDIELTAPVGPIDFRGELDGQGHWIRNVRLDFSPFYASASDTLYGKSVDAGMFPQLAVLGNVGLELAVDWAVNSPEVYRVNLGAVAGVTSRLVVVRDVVLKGSVSVRSGTSKITYGNIGALASEARNRALAIGPNVTSYCDVSCTVDNTCSVGGLASALYGTMRGTAVIAKRLSTSSEHAALGGLATYSYMSDISESFAQIDTLEATNCLHLVSLGGFLGSQTDAGIISDCYGSIKRIAATTRSGATGILRASPFLASSITSFPLRIERCYGWLKESADFGATAFAVEMGGLVGYANSRGTRIDSCFAIVEDVSSASRNTSYIGGMIGNYEVRLSSQAHEVAVTNSWAKLSVETGLQGTNNYVSGICAYCPTPGESVSLENVSVDLTLSPAVAQDAPANHITAVAGGVEGLTVTDAMVEVRCSGVGCAGITVSDGAPGTVSNLYIAPNGNEVTGEYASGSAEVVAGGYTPEDIPGLSGWDFHEGACPTLPSLPVLDKTGEQVLVDPPGSTWSGVWVLPSTPDGEPQLADNAKCKGISGEVLCTSCPDGVCEECEMGIEVSEDGLSCDGCPEGFALDEALGACASTEGCGRGCQKCGWRGECLACSSSSPYVDAVSGGVKGECLTARACEQAGGTVVEASKTCRALRNLCATGGPIAHCTTCLETLDGSAPACSACQDPYRPSAGACRDDCVVGAHATAHCRACAAADGGSGAPTRVCASCASGYSLAEAADGSAACVRQGLSQGGIAAIVMVIILAVIVALCLSVYFCVCKKRAARSAAV